MALEPGDHIWYWNGFTSQDLNIPQASWFPGFQGPLTTSVTARRSSISCSTRTRSPGDSRSCAIMQEALRGSTTITDPLEELAWTPSM